MSRSKNLYCTQPLITGLLERALTKLDIGYWAVTVADSNRRLCPAMPQGERRICKGSIVMAADYNTVHKNIHGSFTTKRARRYFHAREEWFNHIPADMKRFTNLFPVTSGFVDAYWSLI